MREKSVRAGYAAASRDVHRQTVGSELFELAKPGIVSLTLVAALTGIYFGNHGIMPRWDLMFWTFLTLGLATAGSCMLNNYYDRDIDKIMRRTRHRALAAGLISGRQVLSTALLLVIPSLLLMAWMVNPLTAMVTAVGVIGYGPIGQWVAQELRIANAQVAVYDTDPQKTLVAIAAGFRSAEGRSALFAAEIETATCRLA